MVNITDINDINKIIREALITSSEVCGNLVRDVVTEFGVDLDVDYNSSIFNGLSANDTAILFELSSDDNQSNMSETAYQATNIKYYQYFKVKVIMYGNNAMQIAIKTIARLRSGESRDALIAKGVNLVNISEAIKAKEFINNVLWQRCDFTLNIACEMTITPVQQKYEFEGYSKLDIYKK